MAKEDCDVTVVLSNNCIHWLLLESKFNMEMLFWKYWPVKKLMQWLARLITYWFLGQKSTTPKRDRGGHLKIKKIGACSACLNLKWQTKIYPGSWKQSTCVQNPNSCMLFKSTSNSFKTTSSWCDFVTSYQYQKWLWGHVHKTTLWYSLGFLSINF